MTSTEQNNRRLPPAVRGPRRDRLWWWLAAICLAVFGLGAWGYWQYDRATGSSRTVFDAFYASLRLFKVEHSGQGPVPWQLEVVRFVAPLITLTALFKVGVSLARERYAMLRLRFWSDHVVIVGLNPHSRRLAMDFVDRGERVVIAAEKAGGAIDEGLWAAGIIPVRAQSFDLAILRLLRLDRARQLIVWTESSVDNLRIVRDAMSWCDAHRDADSRLACRYSLTDSRLRLLGAEGSQGLRSAVFAAESFDLYRHAARLLLRQFPFEGRRAAPPASPHALVIGSGRLAENLVAWAAMTAAYGSAEPALLTWYGADASLAWRRLLRTYPALPELIRVALIDDDPETLEVDQLRLAQAGHAFTSAYVCTPDDADNVAIATALRSSLPAACRTAVALQQYGGLADVISPPVTGNREVAFEYFQVLEQTCSEDGIVHPELDRIARTLHEAYVQRHRPADGVKSDNPALADWEGLSSEWLDANRTQADHMPIKLRLVGAKIVPLAEAGDALQLTAAQTLLLSRAEHQRWCAQKLMYGWQLGPRDDKSKTHPSLLPWDQLSAGEQHKDTDAVRDMAQALAVVGKGIRRTAS